MLESTDTGSAGSTPVEYRFRFTGTGREYFSIWIVNLLLSILTLGIYSAWAKVRREQYFHRNTLLDEQPFDYTGNPKSILIGRVLALVVVAIGATLQKISVPLALGVVAFYAFAYPWVLVRSIRFRARNTRYRNLAFSFAGTAWDAFKAYSWIYAAVLPLVLASVVLGPELQEMQAARDAGEQVDPASGPFIPLMAAFGATAVLFALLWPVYQCWIKSFLHKHLRYGNAQGDFDGTAGNFYKAFFRALLISLIIVPIWIGIGIFIGIAAAVKAVPVVLALGALMYMAFVIPSAAYFVCNTNTTYAHALIGGQRFRSDMKVRSYAWVLFSNLLLLIFTLGFAWPWIKVRVARYRFAHLALIAAPVVLDGIVSDGEQNISAFGEEAAEFLDFDISL